MENKTIYVFIDASNIWEIQKTKGRFFDYEKLVKFLKTEFNISKIKVFYYTAYPKEGTRNYSLDGKHAFFTYLNKGLGFVVRKKELKRIRVITDLGQIIEEKGNMDVEITIDAMRYCQEYTQAIFFTGDSDFLALINYLREKGKKLYVFSSQNNISEELRTGADGYFDILFDIKEDVWRRNLQFRNNKD